jgi:cytochrome c oxidase subunit IV
MASETHAEGFHVAPLGPRQYIYITIFLGVITVAELALSYSDLAHGVLIPLLIILSAVKFGTVVALFMHLRFEARLFTQMFVFGLILGSAILVALISIFWNDTSDAVGGNANDLPPLEHEAAAPQYFLNPPHWEL